MNNNVFKTQEAIEKEIIKCHNDPYYFATKYIKVKDHTGKLIPFKTSLSKTMFNDFIKNINLIKNNNIHKNG